MDVALQKDVVFNHAFFCLYIKNTLTEKRRNRALIQKNWKELIKPQKLEVSHKEEAADRVGTVVAEPLERGFGLTLGNALRRVLLSSLQGAAVTAIQTEGVVHEFSSLEGVREDMTDIILNIKTLALRMHSEGPKKVTLKATDFFPGIILSP